MKNIFYWLLCSVGLIIFLVSVKSCSQAEILPYKIARDPTWYPLNLSNKKEDVLAFSDELLTKIAEDKHFNIDLILVGPQNLLPGLKKQQFDAIVSVVTPSLLSNREFIFSKPFFLLGPVLLVREDSTVTSIKEMQGKTIGVKRGALSVFELIKHPSIILVPFDNILSSLDDLEEGQIDGVLINTIMGYQYSTGLYKGRLKVATHPLTNEGLRIVALRGTPGEKLIKQFDQGLSDLESSGSYQKLIERWELCHTNDCLTKE